MKTALLIAILMAGCKESKPTEKEIYNDLLKMDSIDNMGVYNAQDDSLIFSTGGCSRVSFIPNRRKHCVYIKTNDTVYIHDTIRIETTKNYGDVQTVNIGQ